MNNDINNIDPRLLEEDDRIVSYLKGKMSMEEESQFLKDLKNNPSLKEKAIITARLVKGLKEVGTEQDKDVKGAFLASRRQGVEAVSKEASQKRSVIKSEIKESKEKSLGWELFERMTHANDIAAINSDSLDYSEFDSSKKNKESRRFRREIRNAAISHSTSCDSESESLKKVDTKTEGNALSLFKVTKWFTIAASLILIIWLGIYYNNYRSTTGLGKEYGDVFASEMLIVRGAPSETEEKLISLFEDVRNGKNLKVAIHDLSLFWELSTMDTYNDYTDYSAEIGWNLAIAHLMNNDKKSAKNVLEKLIEISEEGSAIREKANELISRIK